MADSDYTVAVVLQASDEGMSNTIKQSSNSIEELGEDAKQAQLDLMATVVALEGLTSGLNQVTGGARKFTAALGQLEGVDKERVETLNSHISKLELITGPMEFAIALQKISTIVSSSETVARLGEIKVKESLMIVNNSLVMSMMVWLVVIIAVIAILYVLYKVIFDTEETMKAFGDGIDRAKDSIAGMVQVGKEGVQMFIDLHMTAFEAIEPLTRVVGIVPGLGGD
jgi:hypothetical protein